MGFFDFLKRKEKTTVTEVPPTYVSSTTPPPAPKPAPTITTKSSGGTHISGTFGVDSRGQGMSIRPPPIIRRGGGGGSSTPTPPIGGGSSTAGGYVLPSGTKVPVTPATAQAIRQGKNEIQIRAAAKAEQNRQARAAAQASGGTSISKREKKVRAGMRLGLTEKKARTQVQKGRAITRQNIQILKERKQIKTPTKQKNIQIVSEYKEIYKGVPIYNVVAIENGVRRKPTASESKQFRAQTLTVTKAAKPSGVLGKVSYGIQRSSERISQRESGNILSPLKQVGLGIGASAVSTAIFLSNPVQGVKGMVSGISQVAKEGLPAAGRTLREKPFYALGYVGAEAGQFKGASKVITYAKKPINISITPKIQKFKSVSKTTTVKQGEKLKTIGQFGVAGVQPERVVFTARRIDLARNRLLGVQLPKMKGRGKPLDLINVPKLQAALPSGRLKTYSPTSVTFGATEPFFINRAGYIERPVRKGVQVVGVDIKKLTPSRSTNYVSSLKGFTEPKTHSVSLTKGKLEAIPKTAFAQIEDLGGGKGIKVTQKFPKKAQLSLGEITTQNLFKVLSTGDIKLFKKGSTISRGALVGVRSKTSKVEFPREFGLKEITTYGEKIGFVDISLPKFKPKKGFVIEGFSKELFYELPVKDTGVKVFKGGGKKSSQRFLQDLYQPALKPQLQKQITTTAINVKNVLTPSPVRTVSKTKLTSGFAGTGLYERTIGGTMPQGTRVNFQSSQILSSVVSPKLLSVNLNKFTTKLIQRPIQRSIPREISKEILKPLTREVTKSATREIFREQTKVVQRNIQRQVQRQVQRTVLRQVQRQVTRNPLPLLGITKPTKTTGGVLPFLKSGKQGKQSRGLFTVSLRRFGKFKPIAITRTQFKAFSIGKQATRTTLGATFKIEGVGIKQPSGIFGYKTKKTKKGLFFIEQPKFRLSTSTETGEIQMFKKMKGGLI